MQSLHLASRGRANYARLTPSESGGVDSDPSWAATVQDTNKSQVHLQLFGATRREHPGGSENSPGKMRNDQRKPWVEPTCPTDKRVKSTQELAMTSGAKHRQTDPFDHS